MAKPTRAHDPDPDPNPNPNPDHDPNPNPNIHLFLPIRLLETITRYVLRSYTQLEAILESVPAVTA